jgi:hypothetical protein
MSELKTLPVRLDPDQRGMYEPGRHPSETPLQRSTGAPLNLDVFDSLMAEMQNRMKFAYWEDRATSDRWLAPRVHYSLRLHRSEAADRGVWQWIALRYPWYVDWRWLGQDGIVADDRWWGPVHKQAFARLWWGAEIFRDGPDYRPVEKAFVFQDLPNSYLHRPIVRCRSLALAVVERISQSEGIGSSHVNDLARVLNLATAGTPPEVETGYQVDDQAAYQQWCAEPPLIPKTWDTLPEGPRAADTSESSLDGAAGIVDRGWKFAGCKTQ